MARSDFGCIYVMLKIYISIFIHIPVLSEGIDDTYKSVLGSKTTYHNSFSVTDRQRRDNLTERPSFCRPIQLNAVIRHGIRNPGTKDIDNIKALHHKLRVHSSIGDDILNSLSPRFTTDGASKLTESGSKEQFNIAKRLEKRFRNLFHASTVDELLFISSNISRTLNSGHAFKSAFIKMGCNISEGIEIRNDLMRFYDVCNKYLVSVETSNSALDEFLTFCDSDIVREIRTNLQTRLGLSSSVGLKTIELKAAYVIGAVEEAVFGSKSHWFAMLSLDDLRVLEYATDLKSYWKKSYGHQINYQQSCQLLQHIVSHLDAAVQGKRSAKKAIFRFGHAETLLPLLALLGLFKDQRPLTATTFRQNAQRQFRTSRIVPFSANLIFVLYQCDMNTCGDTCAGYEPYMIEMLFKEIPLAFPFCGGETLCTYSKVRQYYEAHVDECDLKTLCSVHAEL